jgi:chemotaxis regulatin CheY-phosphate phosphatase CheZ
LNHPTSSVPPEKLKRLHELVHGIFESTQEATNDILHQCEQATADSLPDMVSHIYKSCAVQDLTNQRIKIILQILHEIETGQYGVEDSLLEGPQRSHSALSQDDIDNLMNNSP